MKKIYLLHIMFVLVMAASCKRELKLREGLDDFQVSIEKSTYKVNDTVRFTLKGNPDFISFYSGEMLNDYQFKDGRMVNAGKIELSFLNRKVSGVQNNPLSVLVSSDFDNNNPSYAAVKAATWQDISSKAILTDGTTLVSSGNIDLTPYVVQGRQLVVAFRVMTKPQLINGVAKRYVVESLSLRANSDLGVLDLANMTTAKFVIFDQNPVTAPNKSTITTTRISLTPNDFTATNDPESEFWMVSKPVNGGPKLDYGPDLPKAVKSIAEPALVQYTYKYTQPGTYKAYFVAKNANIHNQQKVVREVTIVVNP